MWEEYKAKEKGRSKRDHITTGKQGIYFGSVIRDDIIKDNKYFSISTDKETGRLGFKFHKTKVPYSFKFMITKGLIYLNAAIGFRSHFPSYRGKYKNVEVDRNALYIFEKVEEEVIK